MTVNGFEFISTFPMDFAIANKFGIGAIKDTFKRAFNEWKGNYKYLSELVITLNWNIYDFYEKGDMETAKLYDSLWRQADAYACENLKGEELNYFYSITD